LSEKAIQTSYILASTIRDAHSVRNLQADASLSASELAKALANLTNTTHHELGKINRTAFEIQQQQQDQSDGVWLWKFALIKAAEIVYRGELNQITFWYAGNLVVGGRAMT